MNMQTATPQAPEEVRNLLFQPALLNLAVAVQDIVSVRDNTNKILS